MASKLNRQDTIDELKKFNAKRKLRAGVHSLVATARMMSISKLTSKKVPCYFRRAAAGVKGGHPAPFLAPEDVLWRGRSLTLSCVAGPFRSRASQP